MEKIFRKIKEVGVGFTIVGCIKSVYYRFMQQKYQFDSWHLTPYELRRYAQAAVLYINSKNPKQVVDLGCGLGDIISHIKAPERMGIDLRQCNIDCAKVLNKKQKIDFRVGSFANLGMGQTIDYLITLNFMHGQPEEIWKPQYYKCALENDIRHFMVDVTKTNHTLDFSKILPEIYQLEDRLGPFLGGRYLLVYRKTDVSTEEK